MHKSLVYLPFCLSVCLNAAAEVRQPMETITVTASRTPVPLDETGSSVSIISREDLENSNATHLTELLREIPGFAVSRQGAAGSVTQLRVRGAEANQVLVMIDGIEANDVAQGSEFNFAHVLADNIERVEIVRGPQSALWGSDALAGVINIITRPEGPRTTFEAVDRATGHLEAGSFDTRKAALAWRHDSERANLKVSANHLTSDGTNISRQGSEEDGYTNTTLGLSGEFIPGDAMALSYTLRATDTKSDFDDVDTMTTGLPTDARFVTDTRQRYGGASLKFGSPGDTLDQIVSVAHTGTENVNKTDSPVADITRSDKNRIAWQGNWYLEDRDFNQVLSFVAEYEDIDYEQRGAVSPFGDPNKNLSANTRSLAFEYRINSSRVAMSASYRHDDNSEFRNADTWRLTGSRDLPNGATRLHASVGESVKNPTFTERFGFFDTFAGNPDLKPETSFSWETGVEQRLADDRITVAATWFQARLEDEIHSFVFDPAINAFTAQNRVDDSEREGLELEMNWQPLAPLTLDLAYTRLDATETSMGREIDEIRRPRHTASLQVNYAWPNANLRLSVIHTGSQFDTFFPPFPPFRQRVELDSFTLANLSASYRLTDHVRLTARMDNLFNENYEEVFGFKAPGFAAYGGIRVEW